MAGIKSFRKLQLGRESSKGTAVAATTIYRGLGTLQDDLNLVFPEEDVGILGGVDRTYISKLAGSLAMDEAEATFEQANHIFEAGIHTATPTTDASSGFIYTYDFIWSTTDTNTIKTYTIEGGDNQEVEEMEYAFVTNFKLTGSAGEALMISADWVGRQIALSSFTGSLSIPTVEDILFSKGKLYIDPTSDTAGTTQKTSTFLEMDLDVNTGWVPVDTADGNLYFTFDKNVGSEILLNVTFEHDGSAAAEKVNWRAQTARQIQVKFEGSDLGTTDAGATYDKKTLLVNMVGKWESFDKIDEQDGNDIVKGVFRAAYNATAGYKAQMILVNELSAIP